MINIFHCTLHHHHLPAKVTVIVNRQVYSKRSIKDTDSKKARQKIQHGKKAAAKGRCRQHGIEHRH